LYVLSLAHGKKSRSLSLIPFLARYRSLSLSLPGLIAISLYDSTRNIVHVAVGIPILSCKMPQCIQEKAKSTESALDKGIPESRWERTQCRSSI